MLHCIVFEAGQSDTITLSETELTLRKTMIDASRKRIAEPEDNIWHDASQLSKEKNHLARLMVATASHKAIPPELIGNIFLHAALGAGSPYDICSAPWMLRQICASWRNVVLSHPSIWNSFIADTDIPLTSAADLRKFTKRLQFWVDVVANPSQPLSIEVKRQELTDSVEHTIIREHHARICHLTTFATFTFIGMPSKSFPLLESLSLTFDMSAPYYVQNMPTCGLLITRCFNGMVSLRSLQFNFFLRWPSWGFIFLPPSIPWAQLLSLKLITGGFDAKVDSVLALQVLSSCPRLESCHMDVFVTDKQPVASNVVLPHLIFLAITEKQSACGSKSFIDSLTTPALVDAHIIPFNLRAVEALIVRSGCIVEHAK
ncbi:hypothetical protein H0H87_010839 [Tephrocybe sp. NHM501043]|nr:hypothetical protein H0H87_010839 [Tephrocybe sp. NHM501043]